MNDDEKKRVASAIDDALQATDEQIQALKAITQPISPDNAIGRLSRLEAMNERSVNEAALTQAKLRLSRLEYAKRNIHDDDFGYCQKCGEAIPLPRLVAAPDSIYCVGCAD